MDGLEIGGFEGKGNRRWRRAGTGEADPGGPQYRPEWRHGPEAVHRDLGSGRKGVRMRGDNERAAVVAAQVEAPFVALCHDTFDAYETLRAEFPGEQGADGKHGRVFVAGQRDERDQGVHRSQEKVALRHLALFVVDGAEHPAHPHGSLHELCGAGFRVGGGGQLRLEGEAKHLGVESEAVSCPPCSRRQRPVPRPIGNQARARTIPPRTGVRGRAAHRCR